MKRALILGLTVTCLLLTAAADQVQATPSTHIWAPSTDIQAYKLVHVTVDMYLPVDVDAFGSRVATVTNLGLTVGVLPFEKINMEIGFDHKSGLGDLDNYPLYGNVKVGLPENAFGKFFPAVAVGVFDIGTKVDHTDFNIFYLKAAKTLHVGQTPLGRVSLGYFTGNEELLVDSQGEKDNAGVLAAWERTMTEWSDKLWLCADYMGSESLYGTVNVGLSWKFSPNVAVIGAVDIFNNSDVPSAVTVQVDIDI